METRQRQVRSLSCRFICCLGPFVNTVQVNGVGLPRQARQARQARQTTHPADATQSQGQTLAIRFQSRSGPGLSSPLLQNKPQLAVDGSCLSRRRHCQTRSPDQQGVAHHLQQIMWMWTLELLTTQRGPCFLFSPLLFSPLLFSSPLDPARLRQPPKSIAGAPDCQPEPGGRPNRQKVHRPPKDITSRARNHARNHARTRSTHTNMVGNQNLLSSSCPVSWCLVLVTLLRPQCPSSHARAFRRLPSFVTGAS